MDTQTARELIALNNRFYAEHAQSFSATRSAPWKGWARVLDTWREATDCSSLLDLACGNLRFEVFAARSLGETAQPIPRFYCVDSCPQLADAPQEDLPPVRYQTLDMLDALLAGRDLASAIEAPRCSLVACFGFMHHIPGQETRRSFMRALVSKAEPHGLIAISFWQFTDDARLAAKAARSDEMAFGEHPPFEGFARGPLDPGDHFLGWQQDPRPLRYCHSFAEDEIDALVRSVADCACEVERFSADGSSDTLNRYLILQRI